MKSLDQSRHIDLDYIAKNGHVKMEDAMNVHKNIMKGKGIVDPDRIVAEWNKIDPDAPWGSGVAGDYVTKITDSVIDWCREAVSH
jgi:hypothetical protein